MGIKDDLERFRKVGEEEREELKKFIQKGDLGDMLRGRNVSIPIKRIMEPSFEYDKSDMGGTGQGGQGEGQPQPGDPAGQPQPKPGEGDGDGDGDGEEPGEPGDESGEHERYDMDPEEFAEELDEELDLDLDPKGKEVIEETLGNYTNIEQHGPDSNRDNEYLIKEATKRTLALSFDEDYVREMLKVDGLDERDVLEEAQKEGINAVSLGWIDRQADQLDEDERSEWESLEEMRANVEKQEAYQLIRDNHVDLEIREDDERYLHPEIIEEREKNAVVVNIRDVSGSMGEDKKELVERTFAPMDYYLRGKYENISFIYIAHDTEAWEVEDHEFFGTDSGGGTTVSSAYKLAEYILEGEWDAIAQDAQTETDLKEEHPEEGYPWESWNRYVFAAGDGENSSGDTTNEVIPRMDPNEDTDIDGIDANMHAYVETQPGGGNQYANLGETLEDHDWSDDANVTVSYVNEPGDVVDAIYDILSSEEQVEE